MKKILLTLLPLLIILNTMKTPLTVMANQIKTENNISEKNEINIEEFSIIGGIATATGIMNMVGPYVLKGLASASLAVAYGWSVTNPNINTHHDEIAELANALWTVAPVWVINELTQSWENAVALGQPVVQLGDNIINWFSNIVATHFGNPLMTLLRGNPTIREARDFSGMFTAPATQLGLIQTTIDLTGQHSLPISIFMDLPSLGGITDVNNFEAIPVPTGSFRLQFQNIQGDSVINILRQGNWYPQITTTYGHLLPPITSARPEFRVQNTLPLDINVGIQIPLAMAVDVIESVVPTLITLNHADIRDYLEIFPRHMENNMKDVRERSGGGIGIPLEQARPTLDGFPLEWDSSIGWTKDRVTPIPTDRVGDISWSTPFPTIREGAWEGTGDIPNVEDIPGVGGIPILGDILAVLQSILSAITNGIINLLATLADILSFILTLPVAIFNAITEALIWMFVPTEGILQEMFNRIENVWLNRFPILDQIDNAFNLNYEQQNLENIYLEFEFNNTRYKLLVLDWVTIEPHITLAKPWFSGIMYLTVFVFIARKTSRILSEGKG